jgi:hypothetical protein
MATLTGTSDTPSLRGIWLSAWLSTSCLDEMYQARGMTTGWSGFIGLGGLRATTADSSPGQEAGFGMAADDWSWSLTGLLGNAEHSLAISSPVWGGPNST